MHDQMEATVDQFADVVDASAAFVAEWWEKAEGRRLPGEEGGFTVFTIEFWDGCRFFDYTQGRVFERVSDLGCGPVEVWQNKFVAEHVGQMAYVVRCVGLQSWSWEWQGTAGPAGVQGAGRSGAR